MLTGTQTAQLPALLNVGRLGAFRLNGVSMRSFVAIGGIYFPDGPRADAWQPGILYDSIRISDLLDERPNTCTFTAWATKPALGASVVIVLGSKNGARLFKGSVLDVQQTPGGKPANLYYHVSCIDDTWKLNAQKVSALYRSQSATAIVLDLLATYAPWVGTSTVAADLPVIDEITFTHEDLTDCLKRTAARIGAYHYLDYSGRLHFFVTEAAQDPTPLTPSHSSMRQVARRSDLSQIVTRVLVEGGGVNALAELAAGDTILPVDDDAWYPASGYVVCGPQRISYTGVQGKTAAGSLVGPGVTPGAPPTVALASGAGINDGAHAYAYSWVTAGGETAPSPVAAVVHGTVPGPTRAPIWYFDNDNVALALPPPFNPGDTVDYCYTWALKDFSVNLYGDWTTTGLHTAASPILTHVAVPQSGYPDRPRPITFTLDFAVGDPRVKAVYLWRRVNGGLWKGLNFTNNQGVPPWNYPNWIINNECQNSPIYASVPTLPTPATTLNQTTLDGIAVGPATVTQRKIYRTAAGASQLKLLQTLANNTATTATDSAADATLGANAPTGDTSGLPAASGQVNPGATSMVVASTGWAAAAGGWAVIGNGAQAIRYSGISGNSLTGIPAVGTGAIVASVSYNSTITGAPVLVGIPASGAGAIRYAIKKGDPVNLLMIVDDIGAQQALAALIGGTGVIEDYVQDRRLSYTEATARAQALLRQRAVPLVTLTWISRDIQTHAGATIVADVPPPTDIHDTLKIQTVIIDRLSPHGEYPPTFHATASSERFTLDDLLRQARIEDRHPKGTA